MYLKHIRITHTHLHSNVARLRKKFLYNLLSQTSQNNKKFKQGKRTYIILLYKNVNNGIFYSLKMPTAFNKLSRFKPILAVNRLIYRPGIRLLKEKKSLCLKHIITF